MIHQITTHFSQELYANGYASFVGAFVAEHHLMHTFFSTVNDVQAIPVALLDTDCKISFRSSGHTAEFRAFDGGWIDLTHYQGGLGYQVRAHGYFSSAESATHAHVRAGAVLSLADLVSLNLMGKKG
jgi:hypothetical protein